MVQIWFLGVTGHLLLLSAAVIYHPWILLLLLLRHWNLSFEPALLHYSAVVPATHQPGSGELRGCSAEINKYCVWAFRGRDVFGSFMIHEEDIVFSRWTQVFILTVECGITVVGNAAGCVKNLQQYHCLSVALWWEPGGLTPRFACCIRQPDPVSVFWMLFGASRS